MSSAAILGISLEATLHHSFLIMTRHKFQQLLKILHHNASPLKGGISYKNSGYHT